MKKTTIRNTKGSIDEGTGNYRGNRMWTRIEDMRKGQSEEMAAAGGRKKWSVTGFATTSLGLQSSFCNIWPVTPVYKVFI